MDQVDIEADHINSKHSIYVEVNKRECDKLEQELFKQHQQKMSEVRFKKIKITEDISTESQGVIVLDSELRHQLLKTQNL